MRENVLGREYLRWWLDVGVLLLCGLETLEAAAFPVSLNRCFGTTSKKVLLARMLQQRRRRLLLERYGLPSIEWHKRHLWKPLRASSICRKASLGVGALSRFDWQPRFRAVGVESAQSSQGADTCEEMRILGRPSFHILFIHVDEVALQGLPLASLHLPSWTRRLECEQMIFNQLIIMDSACLGTVQCPSFALFVKAHCEAVSEVLRLAGLSQGVRTFESQIHAGRALQDLV